MSVCFTVIYHWWGRGPTLTEHTIICNVELYQSKRDSPRDENQLNFHHILG